MQPWAQRDLSTLPRESAYQPIQRIPPTEVFPGGYQLPKYPQTGSPGNPAIPATLVSENPPELSTLSDDIEKQDALYLTEDEVFSSRPKLSPAKDGFLQSLTIQSTWIAGSGDNIGMTEVSGSATVGFPAPTRESPLLLTPGYGMFFLVGPDSIEAPATLYQAYYQNPQLGFYLIRLIARRFAELQSPAPAQIDQSDARATRSAS